MRRILGLLTGFFIVAAPALADTAAQVGKPGLTTTRSALDLDALRYSDAWLASQEEIDGDAEWQCLTKALYFEARGEPIKGQFAVAEVILNRVESPRFPDTICGVVLQGGTKLHACQFSFMCDGKPETVSEPEEWTSVGKVAHMALQLEGSLTDGATHYHTTAVSPHWSRVYDQTAKVGDHIFYRHDWESSSR
jgi:spore germination cell wall hydrolase CwlJ-like protein